jgi:hypothetical protein
MTPNREPTQSATDQAVPEHPGPEPSPGTTPHPKAPGRRPPLLLVIIVVLVVTAFVILHLTGVLGPGSH